MRIKPEEANLSVASVVRFLKLADRLGMTVRVHAARTWIEPTYYESKGEGRSVGDLKKEGFERESVFIVATNLNDFGVSGVWYDGKFDHAFVGGQASGHRPAKRFTQITKVMEEINRCTA